MTVEEFALAIDQDLTCPAYELQWACGVCVINHVCRRRRWRIYGHINSA